MNLFRFTVNRPILILMIFTAVFAAGLFGLSQLKVDLLPTVICQ